MDYFLFFLRDRLTQISSSKIWKPWIFGDNDFIIYIILRYSCQYSFFWSFQIIFQLFFVKLQNILLPHTFYLNFHLYVYNFSKYFNLPTFIDFNTNILNYLICFYSVSCYAFLNGMLLLSQPSDIICIMILYYLNIFKDFN